MRIALWYRDNTSKRADAYAGNLRGTAPEARVGGKRDTSPQATEADDLGGAAQVAERIFAVPL